MLGGGDQGRNQSEINFFQKSTTRNEGAGNIEVQRPHRPSLPIPRTMCTEPIDNNIILSGGTKNPDRNIVQQESSQELGKS